MFDLIVGNTRHIPRRPAVPLVISLATQLGVVAAVAALSLAVGSRHLPELPTMLAFVAEPPPAPPPPPPPPASAAERAARPRPRNAAPAVSVSAEDAAPLEVNPVAEEGAEAGVEGGVGGGVEGGVVDRVEGGVVGVITGETAPPPPPPPPDATPVRIGGQLSQPALLVRVEPEYPRVARGAHVQGTVILETIVDVDGRVQDVRVLRSAGALLDRAAMAAIRQWRYAPLELNGVRVRFALTAVMSFRLDA